jgi:hypothetical protein
MAAKVAISLFYKYLPNLQGQQRRYDHYKRSKPQQNPKLVPCEQVVSQRAMEQIKRKGKSYQ